MKNHILNVFPGSLKRTSLTNIKRDLSLIITIENTIIEDFMAKDDLFIHQYNEIFKNVLEYDHSDFRTEGIHSYEHKLNSRKM